MTSKSTLPLDLSQLLNIIPHVFLPRKLPTSEQPEIVEIEQNILRILNAVASHGESLNFSNIAPQTSLMLQNWEKLQPCLSSTIHGVAEIAKTIGSLDCRGMLAFYIRAQNAGMLLSGSMDEWNVYLILSSFPASAPSTTVMSTTGDLAVAVPQQSVWITRTALLTSEDFAAELCCLNLTQIIQTLPVVNKAGNSFAEIRDVANPKLITDWATLALCEEGSREATSFPKVQKKIRDDVMWNNALLPFRRSGLWFTAKVAIHTCLIRELGEELGKAVFKTFMIKVMNFVLMEFSKQSTHHWDIKMQIMAKIARRIEKLKHQHLVLSRCPKNEELFSKIKTWVTMVENEVVPSLKSLRITMDAEWTNVSSSQFHPVADIQLTPDQIGRDLCHVMPVLRAEILKRQQPPQRQTSRGGIPKPNCPNRLNFSDNVFPKVPSSSGYAADIKLWEVETWIVKNISSYVGIALSDATVSSTIRDFITSYANKAATQYDGDPVATSRKILTILRCLRVLDEIACREHPILLEHESGIDCSVFRYLLLPFKSDMKDALSLEHYFLQRNRKYESFMDENEPSDSSVSVRFAKQSTEMCELRTEILKKESEEIAAKEKEIKQAQDSCEDLRQKISLTSCEYHYSSYYEKRVHSDGSCSKCSLEDQHKRAEHSVSRYEKPLPSSQLKQFAVIFDLLIPSTVACLRDMLYFFRAKVCNDSSLNRNFAVYRDWKDYHRVSPYWKGNNQIIFLGSTTKATLDTHYRENPSVLSSGQSSFILENGMTHLVFRDNTSHASTKGSLKKQCTLQVCPVVSPSYHNMQWAIDSCSHTSNSVLARQNTCHADMSLCEFYHFGCLRAGHRIQYRNLLMSLFSGKLSLKSEAVCQLISQAMWEAGASSDDPLRESHVDFSCKQFADETCELLERLISENSENWSEPYILITLIAISSRLIALSPHLSIKIRAAELLRKTRRIACKWTEIIRKLLTEAFNAADEDKLKLIFKLIDTAFVVASSFCVDAPHLHLVMDTAEDLLSWLSSLSILYDEVLREFDGVSKSLSATKLVLLRRIINTGVSMESKISTVVAHDPTVLSEFTKKRWIAATVFNSEWTKLEGDRRQVFECADVVSEEGSTHFVHIDVVLGKFLVDGCPVGKLPEEIVSTQEYRRVFETANFQVQRDKNGVFTTSMPYYDRSYSFCMSPEGHLVIKETTSKDPPRRLELIPHTCFEDVVPYNFMEKFSHWWDSARNKIHFREKHFKNPTFPASPEFTLNLDDMILTENATGRRLLSCTSDSCFLLTEILKRIESPKFIHIWLDKQGKVEIELVRLGLKFRLEGHKIVSHEYPGYFISSNQHLGTLVGLRNLVVLEGPTISQFIQPTRLVIIPHALIQNSSSMDHHQTVEIKLNALRHPTFFTYEVDSRLRVLKAGRSQSAWLYLAALHAATASPLPDCFSGLTGTEMAFTILQSARCWSCQPYDAETLTTLGFIKSLSPCRTYYPQHLTVMEKVNWPANLPSIAALDGFALIVEKLIQDSEQLSILHQSSNISNQSQETSKDDETKTDLRLRHYWRQVPFSNEAATISNNLHPEFHKTQPTTVEHRYDIGFQFENASRVTSQFNHSRTYYSSEEIIPEIRRLLLEPTVPTLLNGLSLPLPIDQPAYFPFPNVSTWIEMELRDSWINLYNVALNVRKNGWEMKWAMVLSSLAFKGVSLDHLLLLQTVARNPSNFPTPLHYETYDNPCSVYNDSEIKSILRRYSKGFPNSSSSYSTYSQYSQALAIWNAEVNSDVESFAADVHNQRRNQEYNPRVYGSKVNITDAVKAINARFFEWYQNIQLKEFIDWTEVALRLTIAGRSLLPQIPPLNLSSPEIAIHPRFLINFEDIMTVEMSQTQNWKVAEELYMKGTWEGICECTEIHPSDALTWIECKEKNVQGLKKIRDDIWNDLLTHTAPEKQVGGLVAADLYPRLVPIKLLPFILNQSKKDSRWTFTRNAIGAVAVLWTLEQRLIRCLSYIHAGPSKEAALTRELETMGHESWSPMEHPGWLILELEVGMMIRPIQLKVANEMLNPSSGKNSVMQLNMGEVRASLLLYTNSITFHCVLSQKKRI
jgi:hypothetical protein